MIYTSSLSRYLCALIFFLCMSAYLYANGSTELCVTDQQLPEKYGSVIAHTTSDGATRSIILIQDAHASYQAQKNIARIIGHYHEQYGIDHIFLEGSSGPLNCTTFSSFPEQYTKEIVCDYFMQKGYIDGAEYLSITTPSPDTYTLIGIDNRELYQKNLRAYLDTYQQADKLSDTLRDIAQQLSLLKKQIYSPELLAYDALVERFSHKQTDYAPHCTVLKQIAQNYSVDYSALSELSSMYALWDQQKQIDSEQLEQECTALLRRVRPLLSVAQSDQLELKERQWMANKISSEAYYQHLHQLRQLYNVDSPATPHLQQYCQLLTAQKQLDHTAILREIQILHDTIYTALIRTSEEQNLYEAAQYVRMTDTFFNLRVDPATFECFYRAGNDYSIDRLSAFLESYSDLIGQHTYDFHALENSLSKFFYFYSLAISRDKHMAHNIINALADNRTDTAIVIAGGFHTSAISKQLEQQGISYVIVRPAMQAEPEQIPYLSRLQDMRSILDDSIAASLSTLKIASWLTENMPLAYEARKDVLTAKFAMMLTTTDLYRSYRETLDTFKEDRGIVKNHLEEQLESALTRIIHLAGYAELLTVESVCIDMHDLLATVRLKRDDGSVSEPIIIRHSATSDTPDTNEQLKKNVLEMMHLSDGITVEFMSSIGYMDRLTSLRTIEWNVLHQLESGSQTLSQLYASLQDHGEYTEHYFLALLQDLEHSGIIAHSEHGFMIAQHLSAQLMAAVAGTLSTNMLSDRSHSAISISLSALPTNSVVRFNKIGAQIDTILIEPHTPLSAVFAAFNALLVRDYRSEPLQAQEHISISDTAEIRVIKPVLSDRCSIYIGVPATASTQNIRQTVVRTIEQTTFSFPAFTDEQRSVVTELERIAVLAKTYRIEQLSQPEKMALLELIYQKNNARPAQGSQFETALHDFLQITDTSVTFFSKRVGIMVFGKPFETQFNKIHLLLSHTLLHFNFSTPYINTKLVLSDMIESQISRMLACQIMLAPQNLRCYDWVSTAKHIVGYAYGAQPENETALAAMRSMVFPLLDQIAVEENERGSFMAATKFQTALIALGLTLPFYEVISKTSDEFTRLIVWYKTGDPHAADALLKQFNALVHKVARAFLNKNKMIPAYIGYDDIVLYSSLGLIKAMGLFDFALANGFYTYAQLTMDAYIRQEVSKSSSSVGNFSSYTIAALRKIHAAYYDLLRKSGHPPTEEEIAERTDMTPAQVKRMRERLHVNSNMIALDAPLKKQEESTKTVLDTVADRTADTEAQNGHTQEQHQLYMAISMLPEDLQAIVSMHYLEEHSKEEIARMLNTSAYVINEKLTRAQRQITKIINLNNALHSTDRLEFFLIVDIVYSGYDVQTQHIINSVISRDITEQTAAFMEQQGIRSLQEIERNFLHDIRTQILAVPDSNLAKIVSDEWSLLFLIEQYFLNQSANHSEQQADADEHAGQSQEFTHAEFEQGYPLMIERMQQLELPIADLDTAVPGSFAEALVAQDTATLHRDIMKLTLKTNMPFLEERERQTLIRHFMQGETVTAIAADLGLARTSVVDMRDRALRMLSNIMIFHRSLSLEDHASLRQIYIDLINGKGQYKPLDQPTRTLFEDHYHHRMTIVAIADKLGEKKDFVQNRITRIKKRLRAAYKTDIQSERIRTFLEDAWFEEFASKRFFMLESIARADKTEEMEQTPILESSMINAIRALQLDAGNHAQLYLEPHHYKKAMRTIEQFITTLTPAESRIVELHYQQHHTLQNIARMQEVPYRRIINTHDALLHTLKNMLLEAIDSPGLPKALETKSNISFLLGKYFDAAAGPSYYLRTVPDQEPVHTSTFVESDLRKLYMPAKRRQKKLTSRFRDDKKEYRFKLGLSHEDYLLYSLNYLEPQQQAFIILHYFKGISLQKLTAVFNVHHFTMGKLKQHSLEALDVAMQFHQAITIQEHQALLDLTQQFDAALPPPTHTIFALHHGQRMPLQEVGQQVDMSHNAAIGRHFRAYRRFTRMLEKAPLTPPLHTLLSDDAIRRFLLRKHYLLLEHPHDMDTMFYRILEEVEGGPRYTPARVETIFSKCSVENPRELIEYLTFYASDPGILPSQKALEDNPLFNAIRSESSTSPQAVYNALEKLGRNMGLSLDQILTLQSILERTFTVSGLSLDTDAVVLDFDTIGFSPVETAANDLYRRLVIKKLKDLQDNYTENGRTAHIVFISERYSSVQMRVLLDHIPLCDNTRSVQLLGADILTQYGSMPEQRYLSLLASLARDFNINMPNMKLFSNNDLFVDAALKAHAVAADRSLSFSAAIDILGQLQPTTTPDLVHLQSGSSVQQFFATHEFGYYDLGGSEITQPTPPPHKNPAAIVTGNVIHLLEESL